VGTKGRGRNLSGRKQIIHIYKLGKRNTLGVGDFLPGREYIPSRHGGEEKGLSLIQWERTG